MCDNWDENMPQQECIIYVWSDADTLNCYFYSFLETSLLHTETTILQNNHISVLLTASNLLSSVHWNDCPTFKNATSTLVVLSNAFEIQWKPAHPQPSPTSLSSERCQCQSYHAGVEKGVFLIFCLVLFHYSELGWQLECYYTQHASVKPGYSSPLGTVLLGFGRKRSLTHTNFYFEYTLKEWLHTGTHAETHSSST